MRFTEFKNDLAQAQPGAPRTKDKKSLFPLYAGPPYKPEDFKPVAVMQRNLIALGYDVGPMGTDGKFGPYTRAALAAFQKDYKIDGDGSSYTNKEYDMINRVVAGSVKKVTPSQPDKKKLKPSTAQLDTSAIQDPNFNRKLVKVAQQLKVDEDDLRKIIKFETAGTFSPRSQDPYGVSIGLIGFTEPTARALGTSKAELAQMTAVEQLDYVYKFYKMNGLRPGSDVGTMYMITFMPAFAYADDDVVLGKKGGGTLLLPSGRSTGLSMHKIWEQNPVFAKSKGKDSFTVGDVKNKIISRQ